jgi:hypothetical protein
MEFLKRRNKRISPQPAELNIVRLRLTYDDAKVCASINPPRCDSWQKRFHSDDIECIGYKAEECGDANDFYILQGRNQKVT